MARLGKTASIRGASGLAYSKDIYDIERFEEIRKISVDIMAHHTGTDKRVIKDVFAGDTGYPTPKVDIRAAVFKDQSILMVREKSDGRWRRRADGLISGFLRARPLSKK